CSTRTCRPVSSWIAAAGTGATSPSTRSPPSGATGRRTRPSADVAEFLDRNGGPLIEGLIDHVILTGIAVGIGLVLSLGLALLAHRRRGLAPLVTGTTGLLYTIPSLALFA